MQTEADWQPASGGLAVGAQEVHVWRIRLDRSDADVESLSAWLSDDELRRKRRFLKPLHQARFAVGRGVLRAVLGRYLERDPGAVEFRYGEHGKPHLAPSMGADCAFNLTHSHDLALLAVTQSAAVGVDLEEVRPVTHSQGIADSYFTERESAFLSGCAERSHLDGFFHLWTCKEAYLKACGKGLAKPLREVEVSLPPEAEPRYEAIGGDSETAWTLRTFVPQSGFRGAVAVEGAVEAVRFFEG